MQFDLSQLESAPLQYFILHSGVFIAVLGATFFILGLWFGALTWGRYKKHKKALLLENAHLKEEMATLKRRIAEGSVKATPEAITKPGITPPPPAREPTPAPATPQSSQPKASPPTPPTPPATAKSIPASALIAPAATAAVSAAAAPTPAPKAAEEKSSQKAAEERSSQKAESDSGSDSGNSGDPLPQLPDSALASSTATAPAIPATSVPAPIFSTKMAPAKNVVKAKPRPKSDEIEPVPFLLGPIGDDDQADSEDDQPAETQKEKTGSPPSPAEDSDTSDQPIIDAALGSLAQPPPPASWKKTSPTKIQLPGADKLKPAGTAPMNLMEADEEEEEKAARIITPREDPSLGHVFTERPNDEDINDLKQIKGISNILEGQLNEFGIYTFKQIASWSPDHVREFSDRLAFKDRIDREKWVEQAKKLAD